MTPASAARRNILVFAGNNQPRVVAAIHRLSCRFTGYHTYDVEYGIKRANFALNPPGRGSGFFSNIFFPGDQPPPLSGNLTFPSGNKKMGLAFPAAFWSGAGDDAVALAGNGSCR